MIAISAADNTIPVLLQGIRTHKESRREGRSTLIMHVMPAGPEMRRVGVDAVQSALSAQPEWRITILPVETTIFIRVDSSCAAVVHILAGNGWFRRHLSELV